MRHTAVVTGAAAASAAALIGLYLLRRARPSSARDPNREYAPKAAELRNNARARGTDVASVYRHRLAPSPRDDGGGATKVYVVTGATSGLGRRTAEILAGAGAHVVLAVRDIGAGADVASAIGRCGDVAGRVARGGGDGGWGSAEVIRLDLASLTSIRSFAAEFLAKGRTLSGLVNNAGVCGLSGRTADGFQLTWQTNCLGHALLTELLLPAASEDFRVVNVSSKMGNMIRSKIVERCPPATDGSSMGDYALSKACQVLHALSLARRFQEEGGERRAFAVEPGLVETGILRHSGQFTRWLNYTLLRAFFLRTIDEGCATTLFCLLAAPENLQRNGLGAEVFSPSSELTTPPFLYANCAPKRLTRSYADVNEAEALATLFRRLWDGSDVNLVPKGD